MHQGRNIFVISLSLCLLYGSAHAQLNRHDEIIEGVQDINLQDDSQSNKENGIQNEEEFQKKQLSPEQQVEDEIKNQEDQEQKTVRKPKEEQEEIIDRKEISDQKSKSYENELKENATKNSKKVEEDINSPDTGFEVDKQKATSIKPNPESAPAQEEKSSIEDAVVPEEATEPVVSEPSRVKTQKQSPRAESPEERVYSGGAEEAPVVYETAPLKTERHLSDPERERLSRETGVDIEADDDTKVEVLREKTDYTRSFKDRRPSWTSELELGMNQYEPLNYESDIIDTQSPDQTYQTYYGSPKIAMPTLAIDFKKNFAFGAVSIGLAGSYFRADGPSGNLTMMVPTVRAHIYLDNFFKEPYVVPYATLGDSYFMYKESFDNGTGNPETVNGKTDCFYGGGGLMFQLDWMDPSTDARTHEETGIQNTFVFVEGRKYFSKGFIHASTDPDFTSGLFLAAGLKFEF